MTLVRRVREITHSMKEKLREMFNTNKSIRMTLFNIITVTVIILGFPSIVVMLIGGYGLSQIPSILMALVTVVICIYIANRKQKLNVAAAIVIAVCTYVLFPIMFFTGGGVYSGVSLFLALGTIFLFMLVDGKLFYILFVIQVVVYAVCFQIAYTYPEYLIPLGNEGDIYIDVFMGVMIVGLTIGLINKFQTKAYENVINTVNEKNEALQESERKAENANRAKTDFLSNMSHEIRTPINAIIGMNEMIKREAKDDAILEYAEVAGNSANALLAIINDILDFARVESGKMEIINETYELYSLINDSYYMIKDRAKEKDLEVIVKCEPTLPANLVGDMLRIRQVIVNLLTNAVKYTSTGSVTLKVSGEQKENSVDLRFDVIDTGIGMKPESLDKLFNKFERLDLEHNRTIEGTGLGLSIVENLVTLMGGTVDVNSEYGKGSTFTVVIPNMVADHTPIGDTEFGKIVREHVIEITRDESVIDPDSRILVVDDVQMNLLVFKKLVKDTKVQVDTALSGKACLEMTDEVKYDLIFMDHMMPEMDGIETYDEIRRRANNPNVDTPVVMLTANALVGMEEKYLSYGFSDYITKPIDITKLEGVLRTYLRTVEDEEDADGSDAGSEGVAFDSGDSKTEAEIENKGAVDSGNNGEVDCENNGMISYENNEPVDIKPRRTEITAEKSIEKIDASTEDGKMDLRIDIETGIMNCGGSKDFYIEVIEAYEEEGKVEELIKAYEDKNWELYTIDAHSLKGTMRLLGAEGAGELGEKMQFAGEAGDIDTITANHEAFLQIIDESIKYIKSQV